MNIKQLKALVEEAYELGINGDDRAILNTIIGEIKLE